MVNPSLDDLAELEDPASWDYENAEPFPGTELPRAAVVVTFSGEDFVQLAKQAEQAGATVTEFVRGAALRALAQQSVR